MFRSLAVALVALSFAPLALADGGGPSPGVLQGGEGILAASGDVRYVTLPGNGLTTLAAVRTSNGVVLRSWSYRGGWGIPLVTYDGSTGGLSADGRTLVVAQSSFSRSLRKKSEFQVVNAKTFRPRTTVVLKGDFAYDALSPDGRTLYLIQHVSSVNLTRYLVRAYDLDQGRLQPGAIADRTQRGWVMQGWPMARATSAGGRFVYTLYQNPGNYPFVHALDAARGVAHCVGLPWTRDQSPLARLRLSGDGHTLTVGRRNGTALFAIDTSTYRVSGPAARAPLG
jgi:hypothetical protein